MFQERLGPHFQARKYDIKAPNKRGGDLGNREFGLQNPAGPTLAIPIPNPSRLIVADGGVCFGNLVLKWAGGSLGRGA